GQRSEPGSAVEAPAREVPGAGGSAGRSRRGVERDALPAGEVMGLHPEESGLTRGARAGKTELTAARGRRRCRSVVAGLGALSLVALLALSCATTGGRAQAEPALPTEDVHPDLWRFWDAHRSEPRADQVRAFRSTVIA